MPHDDLYLPVWAGAALPSRQILPYQHDDEGENISRKNARYSELTAMYWAVHNLDADYLGLVHYRRHFKGTGERGVLTEAEARALLAEAPVVLPRPRNYVIETLATHYDHTHDPEHLRILEGVLEEVASEGDASYLEAYRTVMGKTSGHMFNLCLMRRDLMASYCDWLFPLLAAVEERIDFSTMNAYDERCIGRLSEFLLNTWIVRNDIPYVACPFVDLEPINWVNKGMSFLRAKFFGTPYGKSF